MSPTRHSISKAMSEERLFGNPHPSRIRWRERPMDPLLQQIIQFATAAVQYANDTII